MLLAALLLAAGSCLGISPIGTDGDERRVLFVTDAALRPGGEALVFEVDTAARTARAAGGHDGRALTSSGFASAWRVASAEPADAAHGTLQRWSGGAWKNVGRLELPPGFAGFTAARDFAGRDWLVLEGMESTPLFEFVVVEKGVPRMVASRPAATMGPGEPYAVPWRKDALAWGPLRITTAGEITTVTKETCPGSDEPALVLREVAPEEFVCVPPPPGAGASLVTPKGTHTLAAPWEKLGPQALDGLELGQDGGELILCAALRLRRACWAYDAAARRFLQIVDVTTPRPAEELPRFVQSRRDGTRIAWQSCLRADGEKGELWYREMPRKGPAVRRTVSFRVPAEAPAAPAPGRP